MEPNIWGPEAWTFLHSITLNYPDNPTINDKKYHIDFFNILPNILPCIICRQNLKKHLGELPIKFHLSNKISLCKWLVEIHNKTNIDLGKKTITYPEFLKIYQKKYSNPDESSNYFIKKVNNQQKFIYLLLAIIIFLFIFLLLIFKYSYIFLKLDKI